MGTVTAVALRAIRSDQREEPPAFHAQPAGDLQQGHERRANHERHHDRLPQHRPMCSANCDGAAAAVVVSDAKLKTLSRQQQRRALKVSASVLTTDPYVDGCQVLPDVNTLTRNAAVQPTSRRAWAPRTSTWWSFTTASLPRSSCTTTILSSARRAERWTSSNRARHDATARSVSMSPADCSPKAIRSRPPASPTSGRFATICAARRARPPDRGGEGRAGPRDWPRVSLWRACPGESGHLSEDCLPKLAVKKTAQAIFRV